ncbi:MAG: GSCFA domain-containing protein [Bacteroidaceae bacterium]|nr:GSCFA domain-containing protein [Bacteroidaceae bacterium]
MKVEETPFRTLVDVPKWANPMRKDQQFVLLGSCFAQNMGERFQSYGLNAVCNPLGVTYNPESIAIQVKEALAPKAELPVFEIDGSWRCWWASTLLNDTDEERFRKTIHGTFSELGEAIRKADYLFLTLGTNVCYRLKESGMIVANCHKAPGKLFEEVTLTTEECVNITCELLDLLTLSCPTTHVIFTISPYRYKKYGFHGSQLAKATLLLAVDKVCELYPEKASYFPAYELLLDDLRDYRFYAEDMIHPNPVAVNYIWHKMVGNCMDKEMQKYLEEYEPIRKAKEHKPLNYQL